MKIWGESGFITAVLVSVVIHGVILSYVKPNKPPIGTKTVSIEILKAAPVVAAPNSEISGEKPAVAVRKTEKKTVAVPPAKKAESPRRKPPEKVVEKVIGDKAPETARKVPDNRVAKIADPSELPNVTEPQRAIADEKPGKTNFPSEERRQPHETSEKTNAKTVSATPDSETASAGKTPEAAGIRALTNVRDEAVLSEYVKTNYDSIRNLFIKGLSYPEKARRLGIEGSGSVTIVIDRAGQVTAVSLKDKFGNRLLDDAALKAGKKLRKVNPPEKGEVKIVIPVTFSLS